LRSAAFFSLSSSTDPTVIQQIFEQQKRQQKGNSVSDNDVVMDDFHINSTAYKITQTHLKSAQRLSLLSAKPILKLLQRSTKEQVQKQYNIFNDFNPSDLTETEARALVYHLTHLFGNDNQGAHAEWIARLRKKIVECEQQRNNQ